MTPKAYYYAHASQCIPIVSTLSTDVKSLGLHKARTGSIPVSGTNQPVSCLILPASSKLLRFPDSF